MTIGIRFAARSDVGLLREGNEDSAYAGSRLLAVADGMGGHVGGEIASAAAINTLRPLDTDVPASELVGALEQAVHRANDQLHAIVESKPSLQGMGTTLTAMLWQGHQLALVHIGDSRAYLLRGGELFQITHDHTLVQSLVDEGRISLDEAASHPQRSLLLRALDGRGEVDPDISLREAQPGDRYLLCSDGLSSVVTAETIHHALTSVADLDQVVRRLIDLANRGGGPDNITCVVADVIELDPRTAPQRAPLVVGAAQNTQRTPPGNTGETPAHRAAALRDSPPVTVADMPAVGQSAPPPARRTRRHWPLFVAAAGVIVLLVAGGAYFAWQTVQGQYYVAADDGQVVIFQGMKDTVLGQKLSHLRERPNPTLLVADLTPAARTAVSQTIDNLGSLAKARQTVDSLRLKVCRTTVGEDTHGVVAVWKGKGQQQEGCESKILELSDPAVHTNQLTSKTKEQLRKGISVPGLNQAKTEIDQLRDQVRLCAKKPSPLPGCPPQPHKRP